MSMYNIAILEDSPFKAATNCSKVSKRIPL